MTVMTVLPSVGGTSHAYSLTFAPSSSTQPLRVVEPGQDRRRRSATRRLQALRERAADRVQRMPIDGDSAAERAERAEESGSWMDLQLATNSLYND